MTRAHWKVAALLFGSGFCALIYQTVWLRQFRLIFGASTFATSAVLAIFMAGLGIGSALLGKRADAKERPLAFYAQLEFLIAGAAALSPLLLWIAAKVYFSSGGSPELGIAGATLLRLVLALIVLGPATLLMGGTLPAAARAVAMNDDDGRRAVALLYGVNTLGAVAGALLSTFVLLEVFGNRTTLLVAALINVLVAVIARSMARGDSWRWAVGGRRDNGDDGSAANRQPPTANSVYAASAIAGFAFLLMELVWYRMLSPILGGTTYMFGLILAIALAGIGLGGAAYAMWRRRAATAGAFAMTCSLEALAIAIPFALGDRIAVFANVLRDFGVTGFDGHVVAWTIVTTLVVFPAAFLSGIQFPLLIALLGRGRENVGREIGAAYAWNTAGAIAGSLAGGFGLIPLLTAPGTWRVVAILLALLGVAAVIFARRARQTFLSAATIAIAALAIAATFATGPSALWRHSSIGVGRSPRPQALNELLEWQYRARRVVQWERDGRESSVALLADSDLAFMINGKSDGSAVGDAGTQVMLALLGAALHPRPQSTLIVGLGTGSTAGWAAAVPTMQRVDVVELEPEVVNVARACGVVNRNALLNPKVHVTIGDAREVLLTSGRKYDLIASEPSNPYRAGIASLFTREFYAAAAKRLERGGYFMQWVQMYGIDAATLQTIYATVSNVFPHVQTWQTAAGDLLMLASKEPVTIDANVLRARLGSEPYRSAVLVSWNIDSAEGFLARLIANEKFGTAAAGEAETLNTDDRTIIEFGFARSLHARVDMPAHIANAARSIGADRPLALRGSVDWNLVEAHRNRTFVPPPSPGARAMLALDYARRGDARALEHALVLRRSLPVDAHAIEGLLHFHQNRPDDAVAALTRALLLYRRIPWAQERTMSNVFAIVAQLGTSDRKRAQALYDALSQPFAAMQFENYRRNALIALAPRFDGCGAKTIAALRGVEPNPYWDEDELTIRAVCYDRAGLRWLADRALDDLERFKASEPAPVVRPRSPPAPPASF